MEGEEKNRAGAVFFLISPGSGPAMADGLKPKVVPAPGLKAVQNAIKKQCK
jgi:hypothetical protein